MMLYTSLSTTVDSIIQVHKMFLFTGTMLVVLMTLISAINGETSTCNCATVTCPSTHDCDNGLVPDVCGCCMLCAKSEGNSCHSNEECGSNLTCVYRRASSQILPGRCEQDFCAKKKCSPGSACTVRNNTAVCSCPVCADDSQEHLCDVENNIEYEKECDLYTAECEKKKFSKIKIGPCDDSVQVNCNEDSMMVTVSKNLISENDISSSITLLDSTCKFDSNETHYFIRSKFNECGTLRKYTYSSVIYTNKARGFHPSSPNIIRSSQLHVPFKCEYSFMPYKKPLFPEIDVENKTQSSFGRRINVRKDNGDSGEISVIIDPTKRYIVEFKTRKLSLSNGTIYPKFCYATPEAPSQRWMRYTLIENGCIMEEGVSTFVQSNNTYRIYIPGIRFQGAEYPTITVKCKLVKCITSDVKVCQQFYACPKTNNAKRRRRRNVHYEAFIRKETEYLTRHLILR